MAFADRALAPVLTTVMYHYVRPVGSSAYPRLKALELDAFLGQLDHLQAHFWMISPGELAARLAEGIPLPERACLLTFDDGYADHYRYVFPHLLDRGLSGLFFAPKTSLLDRQLLEVNRIQFVLANHPHPDALADEIDALLAAEGLHDGAARRALHFAPNRFDSAGVAYAKRLLQHVLPADLRAHLTARLFAQHVSTDESDFAEGLYLTLAEAREMQQAGMAFGGHGDRHLWHGLASPSELAAEVAGSVAALGAIGAQVEGGFYGYPFGSQTEAVRTAVSTAGFRLGFTVVPQLWSQTDDRLAIARLDTNDLPHRPDATDPWLARSTAATA